VRTISSDLRRLAFVVLACALVPSVAWADDEAKARDLFNKGRTLAKDGRCAEAIAPFQESLKYAEGVGTLLNLGNCYETLGKTASAHRSFLRAADVAAKNDDKRLAEAKERAHSIEKDVSSLLIHVPVNLKSSAEIRVDGELWPKERWDLPWPIDPGVHDIEVIAPPRPKQTESITVKPHGDKADWAVLARDPATSPVPPPPKAVTERETGTLKRDAKESEGSSTQSTLGLVTGGIGAVGILGGVVSGIISISAHSALTGRCTTYPNCRQIDHEQLDKMNDNAMLSGNISTVSFIVGAVLLAAGAGLYFTAPKR
jgi:hypothetical protein